MDLLKTSDPGIFDRQQVVIRAAPERVFRVIETMPNKFPTFGVLDTRPFFFLRIGLVDGLRSAVNMLSDPGFRRHILEKRENRLSVGDTMGPFELVVVERDRRVLFALRSYFFHCTTGYVLEGSNGGSLLAFELEAERPSRSQRLWWGLFRPLHGVLARRSLSVIKRTAEAGEATSWEGCSR